MELPKQATTLIWQRLVCIEAEKTAMHECKYN